MPHTTKKAKKSVTIWRSNSSNRRTYLIVAVVIVVVATAAGIYAYSALRSSAINVLKAPPGYTLDYAIINTTQGVVTAELFPWVAPKTVANFVNLSESGFYNDLVWHRIVKGFVIQTGDPTTRNGGGDQSAWGDTGSNTTVPLETNSSDVAKGYVNNKGFLGLARGSSNSSGSSQFFINLANNAALNGQYTVFGKVISGTTVAEKLGDLPVNVLCASSDDNTCQPTEWQEALVYSITIQNSP